MAKKITQNKINRLFKGHACDLFDKTCENAELISATIFPGQPVSEEIYVMICERLIVEASAILTERKEKKHFKRKKKKNTAESEQQ